MAVVEELLRAEQELRRGRCDAIDAVRMLEIGAVCRAQGLEYWAQLADEIATQVVRCGHRRPHDR